MIPPGQSMKGTACFLRRLHYSIELGQMEHYYLFSIFYFLFSLLVLYLCLKYVPQTNLAVFAAGRQPVGRDGMP